VNGCIQLERGRYAAYTPAGKYGTLEEITGVLSDPDKRSLKSIRSDLGGDSVKTLTCHEE
jgi:hypothetical protein